MADPRFLAVLVGGLVLACQSPAPEPAGRVPSASPAASAMPGASVAPPISDRDPSYRYPAPERLVAIGDIHGDLAAARRALRLAAAIDDKDKWIGGKLVVVQTGDEIDRGDDDRAVLELFDRLADAAEGAGGRVVALTGNHEAMNVAGDFRYVTAGAFQSFADTDVTRVPPDVLAHFPPEARGRVAAFFPGGPVSRRLARRSAIVMVGDSVFVHGGVTLDTVRYGIGRLNRELSRWMNGEAHEPAPATDPEGPLWTRRYSDEKGSRIDCTGLRETLTALGAKRMFVGHTPHEEGASPACDGAVFRIDTGLSKYYGGPTQVVEVRGDTVTVLRGEAGNRDAAR